MTSGWGLFVRSAYRTGYLHINITSSLKKGDNNLGSVGSVSKSQKSPEISQNKVFQCLQRQN